MKRFVALFAMTLFMFNAMAQEFPNSGKKMDIDFNKTGYYLQESAKYNYFAIGFACLGSTSFVVGSVLKDKWNENKEKYEKNSNRVPLYVIGGALGALALASELVSINYKMKAGKELCIKPNGMSLTF